MEEKKEEYMASLSPDCSTSGYWLELIRAGELLAEALEAERELAELERRNGAMRDPYVFQKARETVDLCAENYAAALRAWRINALEHEGPGDRRWTASRRSPWYPQYVIQSLKL